MITVLQARKDGDICALCGEPIRKGTVFVLKHITLPNGLGAWLFCHLWCDAARRGAKKERAGLPGPRRV